MYVDITKLWFSDGLQPKQLWFETKTSVVEVRAYSNDSQSGVLCTVWSPINCIFSSITTALTIYRDFLGGKCLGYKDNSINFRKHFQQCKCPILTDWLRSHVSERGLLGSVDEHLQWKKLVQENICPQADKWSTTKWKSAGLAVTLYLNNMVTQ